MSKKEKCVNKKLHPYWKTGIYGWLGEEVDDNDYMCCPICGEILAMNYWDYSAEHDGDNKCPECGQELDYSEIYDFEDTLYFRQLLEMKEDCELKIIELKKQLAEKDQAIESLQEINQSLGQTCNNDAKEIERLREQLAEKEKEIKQLKFQIAVDEDWAITNRARLTELEDEVSELRFRERNIKNQTAIAELEKVKDYVAHRLQFDEDLQIWFEEYINNQINLLKGETKC